MTKTTTYPLPTLLLRKPNLDGLLPKKCYEVQVIDDPDSRDPKEAIITIVYKCRFDADLLKGLGYFLNPEVVTTEDEPK